MYDEGQGYKMRKKSTKKKQAQKPEEELESYYYEYYDEEAEYEDGAGNRNSFDGNHRATGGDLAKIARNTKL